MGARSVCRPWGAAVSKDLGLGAGRSRPRVTAARAPTTADRAPRHDLAGPTAAGRLRATVSLRSVEHEHPAFPVSPIARLALRKVGVLPPTAAGGARNSGKPGTGWSHHRAHRSPWPGSVSSLSCAWTSYSLGFPMSRNDPPPLPLQLGRLPTRRRLVAGRGVERRCFADLGTVVSKQKGTMTRRE